MVEMSRDEFWMYIEQCRTHAVGMREFNTVLEAMLDTWDLPKLAAFHKVMWFDIGVYHEEDDQALWDLMVEAADYLGSDNAWDSYGGWLIAQGREFFEAVMRHPPLALTRVPPAEDVWEGESVIFVAQRVCSKKTANRSLYDLFGDHLDGTAAPGVDFPVP